MNFLKKILGGYSLIKKGTIGNVSKGILADDVVIKEQLDAAISTIHVGGITDITYAALVDLKAANGFSEGAKYRITDFRTQYDYSNGTGTCTGAVEPLIVTATSNNTLAPIAYSEDYPNDIIYYDIDSYTSGGDFPYGAIVRRINITYAIDIPFDFRNCKALRYETSVGSGLFYLPVDPGGGEASSASLCLDVTGGGVVAVNVVIMNVSPNPDVIFLNGLSDTNIIADSLASVTFVGTIYSSHLQLIGFSDVVFYRGIGSSKILVDNGATNERLGGFYMCDIWLASLTGTNTFDITKDWNGVTLKSASNNYTNINLSAATHVYASTYNKTIERRVGSQWILWYFNSSSVLTTAAITA